MTWQIFKRAKYSQESLREFDRRMAEVYQSRRARNTEIMKTRWKARRMGLTLPPIRQEKLEVIKARIWKELISSTPVLREDASSDTPKGGKQ